MIMMQNTSFLRYDTNTRLYAMQDLCFFGMVQNTLLITIQEFVFLLYDMAYPNDYGALCAMVLLAYCRLSR